MSTTLASSPRSETSALATLLALRAFVESHGFRANVRDGAVVFRIPFITLAGEAGSDVVTVRTAGEARAALGY
jgi:2,3-bisphosphoglycerate-independent phosphoglycerate mutase